jgi:hypothetical protein
MEAIVIGILAAIIKGETVGAVLDGVTASQWLTLVAGAGETLEPAIARLFGLPNSFGSLGELVDSIVKTFGDDVAKAAIADWLAANADKAIELQPGIAGQ